MTEYDQIAAWYEKARSQEVGAAETARLAKMLPAGAKVLDLGCGTGLPIARILSDMGLEVYGIDSSREMVRRFRQNLPRAPVLCEAAERSDFFGERFDAVVCWGVLFHLVPDDQALVIRRVGERLNERGLFLFTAGDREGVVESKTNGVSFRYCSLGKSRYRELLEEAGLAIVDERFDSHDNYVYLARRRP